jgi:hypothetical protein
VFGASRRLVDGKNRQLSGLQRAWRLVSFLKRVHAMRPVSFLVLSFGLSLSFACSVAEIPGAAPNTEEATPNTNTTTDSTARPLDACAGASTPAREDITKLTACACKAGGKAHCVASTKIPQALASELTACDDEQGRCVPDTIIDGATPLTCAASGAKGRCLSLCVPKVAEFASSLTRGDGDVCPTDERCVPCVHPITGESTGVCDIKMPAAPAKCSSGAVTNAPSVPKAPPAADDPPPTLPVEPPPVVDPPPGSAGRDCCRAGGKTRGKCVAKKEVAQQLQSKLSEHECDEDSELCVPSDLMGPNPTVISCTSLPGGGKSVCVSDCVELDIVDTFFVGQGSCPAAHSCVPCVNPLTGDPTGAPGC